MAPPQLPRQRIFGATVDESLQIHLSDLLEFLRQARGKRPDAEALGDPPGPPKRHGHSSRRSLHRRPREFMCAEALQK
eukprot:5486273-Pyramimonas_sp.AAC.1